MRNARMRSSCWNEKGWTMSGRLGFGRFRGALCLSVLLLVALSALGVSSAGASYYGSFIITVAGTGTYGFSGDGGSAIAGQLEAPHGVAATADGGFLIADTDNNRVRKV